jgi:MoaA/NifB/PqqE/SkfB family radical SAM enzyme
MPNSPKYMPLPLFERIVEKAKFEGYGIIELHNWTEPFLNKNLLEYISIIKKSGFTCWISSNMSFDDKFDLIEKSLPNIDWLVISVSGYNQEVYEVNHQGGRIDRVKANLEYISKLPHNKVDLRFIKFDYNVQDEPLLREYAESIGIDFEVISGVSYPDENPLYYSEHHYSERIKNTSTFIQGICPILMDKMSIDCQGDVYLCTAVPNYAFMRIGMYLNMKKNYIFKMRYMHPFCRSCNIERRATEEELKAVTAILEEGLLTSKIKRLIGRGIRCHKENGLAYTLKHLYHYFKNCMQNRST